MASKEHYCILSDISLHNVGDFLIYKSIKRILDQKINLIVIKPDNNLENKYINIINNSKALFLSGSNLYRKDKFPVLTERNINRIKVPIIPVWVGAQAPSDKDYYTIDEKPLGIIKKIHNSCKVASVRDLHTFLTLKKNGIHNLILTGCPVLFNSLGLPKIRNDKLGDYELFVSQFYPFNRFTLFGKNPNSILTILSIGYEIFGGILFLTSKVLNCPFRAVEIFLIVFIR